MTNGDESGMFSPDNIYIRPMMDSKLRPHEREASALSLSVFVGGRWGGGG